MIQHIIRRGANGMDYLIVNDLEDGSFSLEAAGTGPGGAFLFRSKLLPSEATRLARILTVTTPEGK